MWELIDVNVVAPTVMTHMLLPQMVERGRGAIINVCSLAAVSPPTPLLTEFTATSVSRRLISCVNTWCFLSAGLPQ